MSRFRWAFISVALGVLGLALSYSLQWSEWWSSTIMTISGAVLLVGPLTFVAKKIEERTEVSLNAMEGRLEELRLTVAEGQQKVRGKFEDALKRRKTAVVKSQSDEGFESSHEALRLMVEAGILSPTIGARAPIPNSPHYLRLVPMEQAIRVIIDYTESVDHIVKTWAPGVMLSDVMIDIASEMRVSGEWLGEVAFNYDSAFNRICEGLLLFDQFHHDGVLPGAKFFEDVGGGWYLTDFAIEHAPDFPYQITYERLDEMNWYTQLREKGWVDSDYSDAAIDKARAIRELF